MSSFRGVRLAALAVAAGAAGLWPAPSAAQKEPGKTVIRVGMMRTFFPGTSELTIQAMMRPFQSLMESQTGLSGEMASAQKPADLARQVTERKLHLGVFHGFEFAWVMSQYPRLKPFVTAQNSQKTLHAYLVVRDEPAVKGDQPLQGFADVQGKKLALPRVSREYTLLFLKRRCQELGKTAQEFFADVAETADFEDALDDTIDGKVDCTVVDGISLATFQKRKPGRFAQLKVLVKSEVFPAAVVVYEPGALDEATVKRLREGLLGAHQVRRGQQLLMLSRLSGFESAPAGFEQQLADILRAYPPPP